MIMTLLALVLGIVIFYLGWRFAERTSSAQGQGKLYSFIRLIIPFLTFMIWLTAISTVLVALVSLTLSLVGEATLIQYLKENLQVEAVVPTEMKTFGPLYLFFHLLGMLINGGLLWIIRQFLRHILAGQIFERVNVTLAKRAGLFLLLGSLFTSQGLFSVQDIGLIDFTYVLAGLLAYTLALILEKAIVIAEENEFTI